MISLKLIPVVVLWKVGMKNKTCDNCDLKYGDFCSLKIELAIRENQLSNLLADKVCENWTISGGIQGDYLISSRRGLISFFKNIAPIEYNFVNKTSIRESFYSAKNWQGYTKEGDPVEYPIIISLGFVVGEDGDNYPELTIREVNTEYAKL